MVRRRRPRRVREHSWPRSQGLLQADVNSAGGRVAMAVEKLGVCTQSRDVMGSRVERLLQTGARFLGVALAFQLPGLTGKILGGNPTPARQNTIPTRENASLQSPSPDTPGQMPDGYGILSLKITTWAKHGRGGIFLQESHNSMRRSNVFALTSPWSRGY